MQYITARLNPATAEALGRISKKALRQADLTTVHFVAADNFHYRDGDRFTLSHALLQFGGGREVTVELRFNQDRDVAMLHVTGRKVTVS